MAKTTLETYFQNFNFHVLDLTAPASFIGGGGEDAPFVALSPQVGFQSADIPSTSVETEEVPVGNDVTPHHLPVGAEVGTATLERGVLIGDMEFYRWTRHTIYGRGKFRRTLGVIQVHGMPKDRNAGVNGGIGAMIQRVGAVLRQGAAALSMAQAGKAGDSADGSAAGAIASGAAAIGGPGGLGRAAAAAIQDFSGRAWVLEDCIPVDYDPATDGLGGDSEDITIASIELQPEKVREANFPPGAGMGA